MSVEQHEPAGSLDVHRSTAIVHSGRQQWLLGRRSLVTASDAAAILGASPWGSALSVYAEKVGASEGLADNALLRRGRRMQSLVLQEYQEATGRWAAPEPDFSIRVHASLPWLGATLDAVTILEDGAELVPSLMSLHGLFRSGAGGAVPVVASPLELKTGGDREEWDGDRAPTQYEIQLQIQMAVCGSARGTLAALLSLRDDAPTVRDRERDDAFLEAALPLLERFWWHVQRRIPPDPSGAPLELPAAKKLWRGPGETEDLGERGAGLMDALERARASEKKARTEADTAEAALWLALGSATYGALQDGTFVRGREFKNGARVLDRWRARGRRRR